MSCSEFEILLADYLDGLLPPEERARLEQHASTCAVCRGLLEDASAGLALLSHAAGIEPPPELITRIAYQSPVGRSRQPFERQGLFSRFVSPWLQPILQPRLAMGMAMTILSFAMLQRCTGVKVEHISAADLNPVRIWGGVEDKAFRLKDRAVKYYENLRWVYEVETRLKSLEDQQDAAESRAKSNARNESKGATAPSQGNTK